MYCLIQRTNNCLPFVQYHDKSSHPEFGEIVFKSTRILTESCIPNKVFKTT